MECILIGALILAAISLLMVMKKSRTKIDGRNPPEPRGARPLLGHMHMIASDKIQHRILAEMADRYGPIFSLRLGAQNVLVVSKREVAKECFTVNDRSFSSRPRTRVLMEMGYDQTMLGFAPYGPYWRNTRKLAMSHLLSARRLEQLQFVRDSETMLFVQWLYRQWVEKKEPITVDMKQVFGDIAFNIILRKLSGRRYSIGDPISRRCQNAFNEFSRLLGTFFVSDAFPALAWLDILNGNVGKMKTTARELESFLGSLVDEHRQKKTSPGIISGDEKDFIDVMVSIMEDQPLSHQEIDKAIIGTCMSLILGGNDTTVVTLTWALSILLNKPHELKKVQDELEVYIGNHRRVNEADIQQLSYLKAVVKETLRLYPAVPLSVPREALEECTISGYRVSRGTRLLTNIWKIHRDQDIWENPMEFIPDRFLHKHARVEVTGQDYEFLPFGSGRRMCPGAPFALQSIQLILARLFHAFEIRTTGALPVDMTEAPGLAVTKATSLKVLLTPKPTAELYNN